MRILATQPPLRQALAKPGDRVTAQSIGIDQKSAALGDLTFVWGGNKRCDPTDTACRQGGKDGGEVAQVQPIPAAWAGGEATDKVQLDLYVANEGAGSLSLGLSRAACPEAVDAFVKLCKGAYVSQPGEDPASYERSVAVKISRDQSIVMGALKKQGGHTELVAGVTKPQYFPCAPPSYTSAPNGLSHDAAGLLSVRRNGGSFEFVLTTRANTDLDRDNIVIGRLLDEPSMELLERLNLLPTNNYSGGPLATVAIRRATVL